MVIKYGNGVEINSYEDGDGRLWGDIGGGWWVVGSVFEGGKGGIAPTNSPNSRRALVRPSLLKIEVKRREERCACPAHPTLQPSCTWAPAPKNYGNRTGPYSSNFAKPFLFTHLFLQMPLQLCLIVDSEHLCIIIISKFISSKDSEFLWP